MNRTATEMTFYAKYIQEAMDKKEPGIAQKYFTLLEEESLEMSFKYHFKKWLRIVTLLKWSIGMYSSAVSKQSTKKLQEALKIDHSQVGVSKFGGYAEVPKSWVEHAIEEQIEDKELLVQIRCADIYKLLPHSHTMDFYFPSEGWIYVFAPQQDQYNYSKYGIKYYGGDRSTLVPYISSRQKCYVDSYPISFNIQVILPDRVDMSGLPSRSIYWWFDEEEGSVFRACMEMQQTRNYLFGYAPNWHWSARNLASPCFLYMVGHEEICFGDADSLCIWAEVNRKKTSQETTNMDAVISFDKVEARISC